MTTSSRCGRDHAVRPRDRPAHRRLSSDFRNCRNGDRCDPVPGHRQPSLWRKLGPRASPGILANAQSTPPPGAAVTSMRDVVYFNGHGSSHALIVLAVYAVLGAAVAMIVYRLRARPGAATAVTYGVSVTRRKCHHTSRSGPAVTTRHRPQPFGSFRSSTGTGGSILVRSPVEMIAVPSAKNSIT